MIASYALGQKYYPIPYKVSSALFYILLSSAFVFGVNSLNISNVWLYNGLQTLLSILFLAIVLVREKVKIPIIKR